jgi:hypothetical protein
MAEHLEVLLVGAEPVLSQEHCVVTFILAKDLTVKHQVKLILQVNFLTRLDGLARPL